MILIAESGSTKTEWCIISPDGCIEEHFITDGINPYFQTRKQISHIIRLQLPPVFFKLKLSSIHFYGAGCSSNDKKSIVKASLETQFKTPTMVSSDLLSASRSLFQDEAGIACILSTGSNSCFYDGSCIAKNVRPLGYILGDEGSNAVLGKVFLADCLKGLAPKHLTELFYNTYKIDEENILDFVYTRKSPNNMLSVLSFFLSKHLDDEYVSNLVCNNLRLFLERNVLQYDIQNYPLRFMGSGAIMYDSCLYSVANQLNIYIDSIVENPMQGLIQYHRDHFKT